MIKTGGTTPESDSTDEIQAYCDQVKDEIQEQSGKDSFEMFTAVRYTSQLVAGTNYFVKIQVHPEGECIHARIFKPLPCYAQQGKEVELTSIQTDKQLEDPVEYF